MRSKVPSPRGFSFKKTKFFQVKVAFEKLVKEIEQKFRKRKLSKKDVAEAVAWARGNK